MANGWVPAWPDWLKEMYNRVEREEARFNNLSHYVNNWVLHGMRWKRE